jgi:hypothetical protein
MSGIATTFSGRSRPGRYLPGVNRRKTFAGSWGTLHVLMRGVDDLGQLATFNHFFIAVHRYLHISTHANYVSMPLHELASN